MLTENCGGIHMFQLPTAVQTCLQTLRSAGIDAYLVGGCVRDLLLQMTPTDYDITVNVSPATVKQLFDRTIDTGLRHGTVTVLQDGMPIEITQMRKDGLYTDHRRPDIILPSTSLTEDLARRDFTINAIALDDNGNIFDPFHGQQDLHRKILRTVGDPNQRFNEDALRILRLFRFAAKLRFFIEPNTLSNALQQTRLLRYISAERIFAELIKTVTASEPEQLTPLLQYGGLSFIGLQYHRPLTPLSALPPRRNPRFAGLLYLCGADAEQTCAALKTDKKLRRYCVFMLRALQQPEDHSPYALKKLMFESDFSTVSDLLCLRAACSGRSDTQWQQDLRQLRQSPIYLQDLQINGAQLKTLGIRPVAMTPTLRYLMDCVHKDPSCNQEQQLLQLAQKYNETCD